MSLEQVAKTRSPCKRFPHVSIGKDARRFQLRPARTFTMVRQSDAVLLRPASHYLEGGSRKARQRDLAALRLLFEQRYIFPKCRCVMPHPHSCIQAQSASSGSQEGKLQRCSVHEASRAFCFSASNSAKQHFRVPWFTSIV